MRRDSGGFTLLETIVSLSIVAMIAAALVVAFRLAVSSIERGEEQAREMARVRAGVGIVERTIRSAEPAPIPGGDKPAPFFLGEHGRVRFLSAVPLSGGGAAFRLLCFSGAVGAEPGTEGMTVSEASPFRVEGAAAWECGEGSRGFLPGAREVAFFFSPGPDAQGKWEWMERWDSRQAGGLPAAVRVEFTTSNGGTPLRTSFVVPVPAGGAM